MMSEDEAGAVVVGVGCLPFVATVGLLASETGVGAGDDDGDGESSMLL
jgi:hypothetical protein